MNHAPARNAVLPQEPAETCLSPATLSANCPNPSNTRSGLPVTRRHPTSDIEALHSLERALPNLKQLTNCPIQFGRPSSPPH